MNTELQQRLIETCKEALRFHYWLKEQDCWDELDIPLAVSGFRPEEGSDWVGRARSVLNEAGVRFEDIWK